jgi:tetratricopeptide (TPR) repeat protein
VAIGLTGVADAATIRAQIGQPLQAAIQLANTGNGTDALAKVREAEAVGNLTSDEQVAVSQVKAFIAAKTGAGNNAAAARTKLAQDYNAKRYEDVIADGDLLQKLASRTILDAEIVGQAYYLLGRYDEGLKYVDAAVRAEQKAGRAPPNSIVVLIYGFKVKLLNGQSPPSASPAPPSAGVTTPQ